MVSCSLNRELKRDRILDHPVTCGVKRMRQESKLLGFDDRAGKALDTDKYFVVSSNVLGGCRDSTGPSSVNPKTGRPYGSDFSMVTIHDMVVAQRHLIDDRGIDTLLSVIGGLMGGMEDEFYLATFNRKIFREK